MRSGAVFLICGAIAAAATVAACSAFDDGTDEPADAGAPEASTSGDTGGSIDGGVIVDAADAAPDGVAPACVVQPGLDCENDGCPMRCPAGDGGAQGSDVLVVVPGDASIAFENQSDCHRYTCTTTQFPFQDGGCSSPPVGRRVRVCMKTASNVCGPGSFFSVATGSEVDCNVDKCSYSCQVATD